jgi:hypothetical protein
MLQPQTPFEQPWERQRLRVPREDGTLYCRPDWTEAPAVVADNQPRLDASAVNIQGRTLSRLREWTARAVLERAIEFTGLVAGEPIAASETAQKVSFVVSGHQPSLFHPGVWVKNFAIDALAKQTGRVGLNLIVDNDALSATSIRVPTVSHVAEAASFRGRDRSWQLLPRAGFRSDAGSVSHVVDVPFDRSQTARPWEEAGIVDAAVFQSFADRVAELMAGWGIDPLLSQIWPDAVETFRRTQEFPKSLGSGLPVCLTAARHRLERRWGLRNLELPLSRVCECDPFLWFAGHLFAQAGRFRDVHNAALRQFRAINRVRSHTHPVPELSTQDDWTETPFWLWSASDVRRRRAFVRTRGRETELFDGREVVARFPLNAEMDACCAVEALRELPRRGIRLRTRALTTTLFARLCLADVFVHGIGGATYDEMTDRIIARFFGMPAPAFITMSATVHLPLAEPFDVSPTDLSRQKHELRDLRYNPERHRSFSRDSEALRRGALLSEDSESRLNELIEEKQALVAEQHDAESQGLTRSERRRRSVQNAGRYRRLREISESLAAAAEERERLEEEIAETQRRLAANAVLRNREFSFSLYPDAALRPFLTTLFE